MSSAKPALITRLRRRLSVSVWVFVLLLLGKSALATACQTDGLSLNADEPAGRISLILSDASASSGDVETSAIIAADDDACFHAAGGGCHCSCSHSTVLPMAPWMAFGDGPRSVLPTTLINVLRPSPLNPTLRPPIA